MLAADDQYPAELPLVCSRWPRRQARQARSTQAPGHTCNLRDDCWLGLQVIEHQRTDTIRRLPREQTELETNEGHRQLRPHGTTQHLPGIGTQPRGNIHGHNRQAAGIDGFNRLSIRSAHLTVQPSAKQRIEHDAFKHGTGCPRPNRNAATTSLGTGQGGITGECVGISHGQHLNLPASTLSQGRDQIAVTGIVAVPRQHRQYPAFRPAPPQGAPGSMSGALHQFKTGSAGSDQPRIEVTNLCGAVQHVG
ncbi:hypothetical protein D9M71_164970 [compost metagenome]